jgi:NAD-dependent DNA ligase
LKKSYDFNNQVVVFTGFRDAKLKQFVEDAGGETSDTITKKTTILVTKEADSTSSKAVKAKGMGVKIMSLEEFKKLV